MSKRRKISVLLLCVTAEFALLVFLTRDNEPRYRGRSLSQWLTLCRTAALPREQAEEATDAFRRLGTNALPLLVDWISYEPSQTKQTIRRRLDQLPRWLVPKRLYLWTDSNRGAIRANEARFGFLVMGPGAAPAIPDLARLANAPAGNSLAVSALGGIGPQALPALLQIISNPKAPCRQSAMLELRSIGANALPAVPILVRCLEQAKGEDARCAARTLGELTLDPETSVPALIRCLHSPDPRTRRAAVGALRDFGIAARAAEPELRKALADPDPYVQQLAISAMNRFILEAFTNTPPPASSGR